MEWRVNFFDKNSTETRSLIVTADNEEDAEADAVFEADARGWPESFRLGDAEQIGSDDENDAETDKDRRRGLYGPEYVGEKF